MPTHTLIVDRRTEITCRNFVISRFQGCTRTKEEVRHRIKELAGTVIDNTVEARADLAAALTGMIEGFRICAQNSHLNVQTAICEAATAAYAAALTHGVELADAVKEIAESSCRDFPVVLYKINHKNDQHPPALEAT